MLEAAGVTGVRELALAFHPQLVVEGDNVPFDEKLMQAMPDSARQVLRSLNPQGTLNFYARHWRDDGQRRLPFHPDVER